MAWQALVGLAAPGVGAADADARHIETGLVGRSRCQRPYLMSLAARANEEYLQLSGF
jgi:phosphoheptose isomerase